MGRVFNFNPGPATLPPEVLEKAKEELLDYHGTGMSIMEASHRSKDVESLFEETENLLLELLGLNNNYQVLFLQGGASTQFSLIPLNFVVNGKIANYIITGSFAKKAFDDAFKLKGEQVKVISSTKEEGFRTIDEKPINAENNSAYIHLTSNNTIYGTQWQSFANLPAAVPLVADMSSDILSRSLQGTNFSLIYAGAQKNLGPAGVTIVILKKDFLAEAADNLPSMFSYKTLAEDKSLYNTPPVFAVYIVNQVVHWVKEQGLDKLEKRNQQKAGLIYDVIDHSNNFYLGHAEKKYRSLMNITFRLPDEAMEKEFVQKASAAGLVGLKGHRSVGGIRASIYNAMSVEGCERLADFMKSFQKEHQIP